MNRSARSASIFFAACSLAALGCGARTALDGLDASHDGGTDAWSCVPSAERCNGADDDCDGSVDEGMPLVALGGEIVLRDATELDAGDCTSCFWAWSPLLAPRAQGAWQLFFRIGIYGGREEPNVFTRTLDPHGAPTSENVSAGSEVAMDLRAPRPTPLADGRFVVGATWRIGTDDRGGTMLVAPDGSVTRAVFPVSRTPSLTLMAGERVVTIAGADRRAEVRSQRVDGSDLRESAIDDTYFTVADAWADRVGVVVLHVDGDARTLHFALLDALGTVIVPPSPIDVAYDSYPRLVGTSEGWMIVVPRRNAPARRALLTREGALAAPLEPFDDEHVLADAPYGETFVHHPREPSIVHVFQSPVGDLDATMHVQVLDEHGHLLRAFEAPAPGSGAVGTPSVAFAEDGRLLVTWHDVADDSERNRVYVRELGCGD
ncbi:MAG: hypothetical protein U0234_24005 [Sandaracinus sp.]